MKTGTNGMGLKWASKNGVRVVAYSQGGYSVQHEVKGIGWCLYALGEGVPEETERALCAALKIDYEA